MRICILTGVLCLFALAAKSQDNPDIAHLEVKNLSGELVNIVKTECTLQHISIKSTGVAKQLLQDSAARARYILQFQQQVATTYVKILPTEFIFAVNKNKLVNFGDDALSRFKTGSAGRYVDDLIAPVISGGIQNYLKDTIQAFLKLNEAKINQMVSMASSTFLTTSAQIASMAEAEIREKIIQLFPSTNPGPLYNKLVEQVTSKLIYYKSHTEQLVLIQVKDIKTLAATFHDIESNLNAAAKKTFTHLGESIKILADNEDVVGTYVDAIRQDIQTRAAQIHTLESDIVRLGGQTGTAATLAAKQLEHAKLVAQNLFQTQVINNYLHSGLTMIGKIDDIKRKAETLFSSDYLANFKKRLDGLKTPTLSSVVNFASTAIGTVDQVAGAMQNLGILKGGAAQTVGKFVKYANLAVGIATALMPPNPIGIIGALGSLGGLFGGGGPSLEEQMFQAMQDGFNQINQRLDQIEEKLDKLTDFVEHMYKDIMQSLNAISSRLDIIEEKIDLQNQMQNYSLYANYNLVEEMIKNKIDDADHGLEYYNRWYNTSTANNVLALQALDVFVSSPDNLNKVIREDFTALGSPTSIKQIAAYDINAYKKTLALFKILHPTIDQDNKIKNLLLLPAKNNGFYTIINGSSIVPDNSYFNFESVTENYFNPYFLGKVASQFIELHPFFIIYKRDDARYLPIKTLPEFNTTQTIIHDRLVADQRKLGYLLDMTNASLVQQSIFSGYLMMQGMNSTFFQNGAGHQEAIDALNSNELLAKNFSCFLINSKIDDADKPAFSNLYYAVMADHQQLPSLNALLKYGDGRLQFGFSDPGKADPFLHLNLIDPATGTVLVRMPVPELGIIEDQRMQYSDAYYSLLKAKDSIVNESIDIGFFGTLSSVQANEYKSILLMNSN